MSSLRFYADLPEISVFEDVVSRKSVHEVPDDWHVVVTDVKGSTKAIESGRYKDVNALGVATIVGLRNSLPDVEIPYVFGGDGATLLVPESHLAQTDCALRGLSKLAHDVYDMGLRCARVSVRELRAAGGECLLGRFRTSPHISLAVFSGAGYSLAEEWIKDPDGGRRFAVSAEGPCEVELEGFECRWEPAPSRRGRILSLLVVAVGNDSDAREQTYRQVVAELQNLGISSDASPIGAKRLRLSRAPEQFDTEARIVSRSKSGESYDAVVARAVKQNRIARLLQLTGLTAGGWNAKNYQAEFVENTDYRKFDEALRMVLDVTTDEVKRLDEFLAARYQAGDLAYGMHLSERALITCMVRSYSGDHVHFVDGSDGGYALAARGLKSQLKALAERTS